MSIQKKRGIFIPPKDEDESINNNKKKDKKVYDNNNNYGCPCWVCNDLEEQIKSLQKAQARTKQDTNKILGKITKLEAFFQ